MAIKYLKAIDKKGNKGTVVIADEISSRQEVRQLLGKGAGAGSYFNFILREEREIIRKPFFGNAANHDLFEIGLRADLGDREDNQEVKYWRGQIGADNENGGTLHTVTFHRSRENTLEDRVSLRDLSGRICPELWEEGVPVYFGERRKYIFYPLQGKVKLMK